MIEVYWSIQDPTQYAGVNPPDSLTQTAWTLSPLGKEFLLFIASPEQLE
jgi:hypothetical protein